VLAMVGGAGLLARRFGVPGITKSATEKRLAIVETLMVGPRQRLFIVRRDNVEHLVLSTPDGASVIESGIAADVIRPAGSQHEQESLLILRIHAGELGFPSGIVLRVLLKDRYDAADRGGSHAVNLVVGHRGHSHVSSAVPG